MIDDDNSGSISEGEFLAALNKYHLTPKNISKQERSSNFAGGRELSLEDFIDRVETQQGSDFQEAVKKMDGFVNRENERIFVFLFLLLTFLVLVNCSTQLFHFFACESFLVPGGSVSYLTKDMSINCSCKLL